MLQLGYFIDATFMLSVFHFLFPLPGGTGVGYGLCRLLIEISIVVTGATLTRAKLRMMIQGRNYWPTLYLVCIHLGQGYQTVKGSRAGGGEREEQRNQGCKNGIRLDVVRVYRMKMVSMGSLWCHLSQ